MDLDHIAHDELNLGLPSRCVQRARRLVATFEPGADLFDFPLLPEPDGPSAETVSSITGVDARTDSALASEEAQPNTRRVGYRGTIQGASVAAVAYIRNGGTRVFVALRAPS